ncbi:hypothetical protein LEP1GSC032_0383 [Leptospira interrogans str. 2002000631]|nr:hypothetical protein LEP1GSC027_2910 [Leptospira interrogans str. 2002000624]EKQ39110.1 hypothetical protein LEP1GSC025_1003 [Leptospira interrogans str. 2002000621]EKQ46395.1 hypothetical protein LEP1GSC026_1169 [Leptospira interrogans str. 2002000623]EMJ75856.1 hypothetical protein LEP1GSC033_3062 [Leptospira interrogans str. 2002000632]EMJ85263.1 hypothetical protein LEP1GSC032_0383 [Leptospira interrogans str. 2002000631]
MPLARRRGFKGCPYEREQKKQRNVAIGKSEILEGGKGEIVSRRNRNLLE